MDDTPLEAGLMFTCKLKTKTDFQGRAALEEQKNLGGPKKKKVCFTLDHDKQVETEKNVLELILTFNLGQKLLRHITKMV